MLNSNTEAQIKDTLGSLEAAYDPGNWDLMAQRLDFEAQEEIDLALEQRLTALTVPMPFGSWEALEKMIEADETAETIETEALLDNIAHEKMGNLTVPYQAIHWDLMAKRIEEEFSLRHKLYRYKIAELALISLLLFTIIRFAPLMGDYKKNENTPASSSTYQAHGLDVMKNGSLGLEAALPSHKAKVFSPTLVWRPNPFQFGGAIGSVDISGSLALSTVTPDNQSFETAGKSLVPHADAQHPSALARNDSKVATLPYLQMEPVTTEGDAQRTAALATLKDQIYTKREGTLPTPLAVLPITAKTKTLFGWELPLVKIKQGKVANDLRFNVLMTTDFNYVTTPANQITVFGEPVNTKRNETIASGYGGGLNISWKRQRWEYQTGGIYSFKRYIPNLPIFIFDTPNFFIKEDFNGIQLDIFQLPLNVLYHFKNTGKWRFYSSVGASAHFVTATLYEIDHTSKALRSMPPVNLSPDDKRSITNDEEGTLEFPSGILDGGKLRGNLYFSANLGVGVERYLSPKWTVFFQPNYQHFFLSEGIGDNKDKIYTTSFYLGAKFNLK